MKKSNLSVFVLLIALTLMVASSAFAHEFILKPVQLATEVNNVLPFRVISAHVFMISEEMEPVNKVEANFLFKGKSEKLSFEEDKMLMSLSGQCNPSEEGTAILAGHRKGMIWTQTTQGWKQQSKKGLKGVIHSGKYEKFCKTLITVGKADGNFNKIVGHKLEIVPLSDPAKAKVGDEIVIQTLFEGKPITVENVLATYDGFSQTPNTYAYFTEPYGEGMAKVKISHPGVWMIRVQHKIDKPTADYDSNAYRAVLVFEVK